MTCWNESKVIKTHRRKLFHELTDKLNPARVEKVRMIFSDIFSWPFDKLVNVIDSNHLSTFSDLKMTKWRRIKLNFHDYNKQWFKPTLSNQVFFMSPHSPLLWRQSLCCRHSYEKYTIKGYLLGLSTSKQLLEKNFLLPHLKGLSPHVVNGDRVGQRGY